MTMRGGDFNFNFNFGGGLEGLKATVNAVRAQFNLASKSAQEFAKAAEIKQQFTEASKSTKTLSDQFRLAEQYSKTLQSANKLDEATTAQRSQVKDAYQQIFRNATTAAEKLVDQGIDPLATHTSALQMRTSKLTTANDALTTSYARTQRGIKKAENSFDRFAFKLGLLRFKINVITFAFQTFSQALNFENLLAYDRAVHFATTTLSGFTGGAEGAAARIAQLTSAVGNRKDILTKLLGDPEVLRELNKHIADPATVDRLAKLAVNAHDLEGRDPAAFFIALSRAVGDPEHVGSWEKLSEITGRGEELQKIFKEEGMRGVLNFFDKMFSSKNSTELLATATNLAIFNTKVDDLRDAIARLVTGELAGKVITFAAQVADVFTFISGGKVGKEGKKFTVQDAAQIILNEFHILGQRIQWLKNDWIIFTNTAKDEAKIWLDSVKANVAAFFAEHASFVITAINKWKEFQAKVEDVVFQLTIKWDHFWLTSVQDPIDKFKTNFNTAIENVAKFFIDKFKPVKDLLQAIVDLVNIVIGQHPPTTTSSVRSFASGGVVPGPRGSPQLAMVHGGETILPNSNSSVPIVVQLVLDRKVIAEVSLDAFNRFARQHAGMLPFAVGG